MAKVTLKANAKVQGVHYKAGGEVDVKKKELVDELIQKGLVESPKADADKAGE